MIVYILHCSLLKSLIKIFLKIKKKALLQNTVVWFIVQLQNVPIFGSYRTYEHRCKCENIKSHM